MSLLRFFDTRKVRAFAKEVVAEYVKVNALVDSSKKHAGRKPERMVVLVRKISAFVRSEGLNFYLRAKLFSEIKDGLKAQGVKSEDADGFVRTTALEGLRLPK